MTTIVSAISTPYCLNSGPWRTNVGRRAATATATSVPGRVSPAHRATAGRQRRPANSSAKGKSRSVSSASPGSRLASSASSMKPIGATCSLARGSRNPRKPRSNTFCARYSSSSQKPRPPSRFASRSPRPSASRAASAARKPFLSRYLSPESGKGVAPATCSADTSRTLFIVAPSHYADALASILHDRHALRVAIRGSAVAIGRRIRASPARRRDEARPRARPGPRGAPRGRSRPRIRRGRPSDTSVRPFAATARP